MRQCALCLAVSGNATTTSMMVDAWTQHRERITVDCVVNFLFLFLILLAMKTLVTRDDRKHTAGRESAAVESVGLDRVSHLPL
jgi:hypothetical protein